MFTFEPFTVWLSYGIKKLTVYVWKLTLKMRSDWYSGNSGNCKRKNHRNCQWILQEKTATVLVLKEVTRGNYIMYFNQVDFSFSTEACRPNSLIVQCFTAAQTMIECTYSLISSCRLSVHSALIITNVAGSKHKLRVAGFQRNEGGEIMSFSLAIFYWSS